MTTSTPISAAARVGDARIVTLIKPHYETEWKGGKRERRVLDDERRVLDDVRRVPTEAAAGEVRASSGR